jgi:hypothetical protein
VSAFSRRSLAVVALTCASVSGTAFAQEEFGHTGALGLLVSGGGGGRSSSALNNSGFVGVFDLGGTLGIFEHRELLATARLSVRERLGLGAQFGLRNTYGLGQWKTFFDLTLSAELVPAVFVGPRGAFGVQLDLGSLVGVFACVGATLGFGNGLFLQADLSLGVQIRSYLFE